MYGLFPTADKAEFLEIYIPLLLEVINSKEEVGETTRHVGVQCFVQVFLTDAVAFKAYATRTNAEGLPMLTPPERTLIETIIRNF